MEWLGGGSAWDRLLGAVFRGPSAQGCFPVAVFRALFSRTSFSGSICLGLFWWDCFVGTSCRTPFSGGLFSGSCLPGADPPEMRRQGDWFAQDALRSSAVTGYEIGTPASVDMAPCVDGSGVQARATRSRPSALAR